MFIFKGKEFLNAKLDTFFKQNNIVRYNTYSTQKSFIVERLIGRFRQILAKILTANKSNRWIDYYQHVCHNINHTVHKSIKLKPADVNKNNYQEAWNNLYAKLAQTKVKPPKYKPNDLVRVSIHKLLFEKGSTQSFSDEVFEIKEVLNTFPVVSYRLKTQGKDEILQGTFLEPELSLVQKN